MIPCARERAELERRLARQRELAAAFADERGPRKLKVCTVCGCPADGTVNGERRCLDHAE